MKITEPSIEIREKTKSVKPTIINYDALPDLILLLLFKKREKHLSRNHRGGTILLIKFQAAAWHFTKSDTHAYVFFTFFKLHEW